MIVQNSLSPPSPPRSENVAALRELSEELEATFLSEMLKSAGFGEARESFGGGIGEEQFTSFLRDAYAKTLVQAGGIGLAEHLFNSLKAQSDAP